MSSVFKGLNRSDVYLTDYNSQKKWKVSGQNLAELGIKVYTAMSSSRPYYPIDADTGSFAPISGSINICGTSSFVEGTYNQVLAYGTLFETYYSGSLGDGTFEGPKDLFLQTNLTITGSRVLPTRNWRDDDDTCCLPEHQQDHNRVYTVIVSIPKDVFGTHISPGTFKVDVDEDVWCYVEDDYISHETGSFCDEGYPEGTYTRPDHWVDPYFEDLHLPDPIVDFEGVLIGSGSGFLGNWHWPNDTSSAIYYRFPTPLHEVNQNVGDVIYTHGNAIFTNEFLKFVMANWNPEGYSFESNKPIFTKHVTCKVRDIDFNRSYNPTATEELQNTDGFTTYVSAVGLYNTKGDLLAVAKLSKPIKKPFDTEMTFDLQIDLG